MQRYQVNYKLLIGLIVGAVVTGGGLFGLWAWQSYRGATKLLTVAEEEMAKGNTLIAAQNLWSYCQKRPNDEEHAIEMAMTFAEVAENEDESPQDRRKALGVMEATVRKWRKHPELRKRLVDLLMGFGASKDAAEHLEIMLNDDTNNPELIKLLATCYLRMAQDEKALQLCAGALGYDQTRNKFEEERADAAGEIDLYSLLAAALQRAKTDPAKVDAVMEQVVTANPEDADAFVARARHHLSDGEESKELAVADLTKALEIDENNLNAILLRSRMHARDEEFAEAKVLLERGLADAPDNGALYATGAYVANMEEGPEAALEWYDRGVKATTGSDQISLKVAHARALINARDLAAANAIIDELAELPNFQKAMLDYLRARIMVTEEKWYPAADALTTLRPVLQNNTEVSEELNYMLTLCYTRLEMWQEAINSAGMVLQLNPMNQIARDLQANAQRKLGLAPTTKNAGTNINELVSEQLRKPEDEREWGSVLAAARKFADGRIEDGLMTEAGKKLLIAEIRMQAKQYSTATKLVREAIQEETDNINTWLLACRLTAADPNGGAVKALRMLDQVEGRFQGDDRYNAVLALTRAGLYMALNDEDVVQRMLAVAEGADAWPKKQQVQLWQGLATRFEAMREKDALEQARTKIAQLAPNELSNLLDMFVNARTQNDDARMADIQDRILKVVGDKQDAYWQYTEAHRLISLYQRGVEDKSALEQARQLVEKARQQRSEWHMLYLLLADLAVEQKDPLSALENLDKAAELGPPTARSLMQHVSLLLQTGRFDDARKQIDRSSPEFRERLLGRQYAQALLNSRYLGERAKRWEESVDVAQKVAGLTPDSGEAQLWLGRFMLRASMSRRLADTTRERAKDVAADAFARAVELTPKSEEAWLAYFGYLSTANQPEAIAKAVRQVQLSLDEDALPLVLAAGYEMQGRWLDAENVYSRAREAHPENTTIMRRLASFYLGNRYRRDDRLQKATPLLNQLIKMGAEDEALAAQGDVLWARRTAAKLLAQTGDYQKALDAERLLRSNVVNGQLTYEDKLTMAKILATRPEPGSKLKAISLYENVGATRDLAPSDQLTLGQLYFATGAWESCKRTMTEVTSRNRSFVAARDAYIRMLLVNDEPGDLKTAASQLKNLQEFAPTDPSTLELLVRISSKLGRKEDVVPVLKRLLSREENRRSPQVIVRVAKLLADLDDLDNAEKLFKGAAGMAPRLSLEYADFLGRHRSLDDALDLLDQVRSDSDDLGLYAIQYASALLKAKGEEVSDEQFARVGAWLTRALREDPESVKLLMQQAELLDTQRQYAESADVYRQLLSRDDVKGFERAVVLNNLAYQLAMTTSDAATMEESMGYVAEAVDILGPRSDILDTRAVVHMAMNQPGAAVADMELSVTDGATASKYFHLARAQLMAGDTQKAVEAWDTAVDMGLDPSQIGIVERKAYEEVQEKIERLKSSGAGAKPAA